MKKTYVGLFALGVLCTLVSILVLCFAFDYREELFKDALVAIFTGCVFAFPTSLLQAKVQKQTTYENESKLAKSISETLNCFPDDLVACNLDSTGKNDVAQMRVNVQKLDELAISLGNLDNDYHLAAEDAVSELLNELYNFRSICKTYFMTSHIDSQAQIMLRQSKKTCLACCEQISKAP